MGNVQIGGTVTKADNPRFLAFNSAADLNVTGNGAQPTVEFDTEVYDVGGVWNNSTDTFTASVAGEYHFDVAVNVQGLVAATIGGWLRLITTNRTYILDYKTFDIVSGAQQTTFAGSVTADFDASDTATVDITVNGDSGDNADVHGHATTLYTYISGFLVG